ncbi:Small glutamine-rich tetratricopeptide repeat-containing protein alpha [Schistosoma japonicum]|nr:Small glutamine-rich tetratricopeptide repeat-containing protein alpha [Schistosoma japonicum]
MADKAKIYRSIARFFDSEINSNVYSSEITEGLEASVFEIIFVLVAKQCIETAFHISNNEVDEVPDLQTLFESKSEVIIHFSSHSQKNKNIPRNEPSEETKSMAEALKNQGNQCMKQEKFEEAVACYSKAIELSPYNAVFYCNRAAAHSRLDHHQDAINDCLKALEIDPYYSKAYGRMGIAYSSIGNHAKAVECYRKGLELDPNNENCQQNLSIAEEKLKNSSDASQSSGLFGGFDLNSILSNPMMQNMARQFMSDPNAQNMMTNLLRNTFGMSDNPTANNPTSNTEATNSNGSTESNLQSDNGTGVGGQSMDEFLRLGQQLAQQLQASNPQLVNHLRQTFHTNVAGQNSNPENNPNFNDEHNNSTDSK